MQNLMFDTAKTKRKLSKVGTSEAEFAFQSAPQAKRPKMAVTVMATAALMGIAVTLSLLANGLFIKELLVAGSILLLLLTLKWQDQPKGTASQHRFPPSSLN
jgi:hypothetical protein